MRRPRLPLRQALLCLVVPAVFAGPLLSRTFPPREPAVYRLEPGSSYQRGCLDPSVCEVPEPVPLAGTFALTGTHTDFDVDGYEVSEVSFHAASGEALRIFGSGDYRIHSPFGIFQVMTLDLIGENLPVTEPLRGRMEGVAGLPRIHMTLTANVAPYDDAVMILQASPVPPEEIQWYRLVGGSEYREMACDASTARPLTGTFGLVEVGRGSPPSLVRIRWTAAPARGASDPSPRLILGTDGVILSEDGLLPGLWIAAAEIPDGGAPVLDFSLTQGAAPCVGKAIRVRAKRN